MMLELRTTLPNRFFFFFMFSSSFILKYIVKIHQFLFVTVKRFRFVFWDTANFIVGYVYA